jgi:hypothetical protein
MTRAISWQRNLAVLSAVQVISTLGFGLIFPFLPLYVRDLGVSTTGSLEFWAGLAFSAQAFTMMIASPIWGTVADRSGRKLMLERATLGGAIIVGAMGFVQNAEQLVILRALQGATTGVIAANNALVAAQTPKGTQRLCAGRHQHGALGRRRRRPTGGRHYRRDVRLPRELLDHRRAAGRGRHRRRAVGAGGFSPGRQSRSDPASGPATAPSSRHKECADSTVWPFCAAWAPR